MRTEDVVKKLWAESEEALTKTNLFGYDYSYGQFAFAVERALAMGRQQGLEEAAGGKVLISKECAEFAAKCCASDNDLTERFLTSRPSFREGDKAPDYLIKEREHTEELRQAIRALLPEGDAP